jgi:hypothetical protein
MATGREITSDDVLGCFVSVRGVFDGRGADDDHGGWGV